MQLWEGLATPGVRILLFLPVLGMLPTSGAMTAELEVFRADSLAGPMRELKNAFQANRARIPVNLTTGVSCQLAE